MKRTKLICVAGARPNFMKVAPLWRLLSCDRHFACVLVHTGQHYDEQLSGQFFRDLALPEPHHYLGVGSGSHAQQTAEVMRRFEPVLETECADGVIVVGDVNSTMAATVVAAKMHVPVCHVEAGLRSFDRSMPEEINRLITDAISDVLLVSEASGRRNLLSEGIPEYRIHLVGNLMIDSLRQCLGRAQRSGILSRLRIDGRPFGLVNLHRPASGSCRVARRNCRSIDRNLANRASLFSGSSPHENSFGADDNRTICEHHAAGAARLPQFSRPDVPQLSGSHGLWRHSGRDYGSRDSVFDIAEKYRTARDDRARHEHTGRHSQSLHSGGVEGDEGALQDGVHPATLGRSRRGTVSRNAP